MICDIMTTSPTRLPHKQHLAPTILMWLATFVIAFAMGCSYRQEKAREMVQVLQIDPATLSFIVPTTGDVFHLHLGDELYHDTGGMTEVPPGMQGGVRDATSSFYEPKDKNGGGYAAAESLYRRDWGDVVARNSTVQFLPDSGRLLITEDKSDGAPCRRYILYTVQPRGGYCVTYLAPPWKPAFATPGLSAGPPNIELLSGDRAKIEGKLFKISDIPQSKHPFSMGG